MFPINYSAKRCVTKFFIQKFHNFYMKAKNVRSISHVKINLFMYQNSMIASCVVVVVRVAMKRLELLLRIIPSTEIGVNF